MIDDRRGFIYNTNEVFGSSTKRGIDFSAGLLLYSKYYFGGLALHHLNQPDEGVIGPSKLPMKITIHGGANIFAGDIDSQNMIISPTLLYMQQQDFHMLLLGMTVKYKVVSLGVSYRSKDAFITTLPFPN